MFGVGNAVEFFSYVIVLPFGPQHFVSLSQRWPEAFLQVKATTLDKERTIPKIRDEKNAVPSCDIMLDHGRSAQGKSTSRGRPCPALSARDQAWHHNIEQCSSRRKSQGWFFFFSRVEAFRKIASWLIFVRNERTRFIVFLLLAAILMCTFNLLYAYGWRMPIGTIFSTHELVEVCML